MKKLKDLSETEKLIIQIKMDYAKKKHQSLKEEFNEEQWFEDYLKEERFKNQKEIELKMEEYSCHPIKDIFSENEYNKFEEKYPFITHDRELASVVHVLKSVGDKKYLQILYKTVKDNAKYALMKESMERDQRTWWIDILKSSAE